MTEVTVFDHPSLQQPLLNKKQNEKWQWDKLHGHCKVTFTTSAIK